MVIISNILKGTAMIDYSPFWETLKKTNQDIIETLDKVLEIHENGRIKRQQAESELEKIEGELKEKLLKYCKENSLN